MRKVTLILVITFVLLLSGCDESNTIVQLKIVRYPDNLIYILGKDVKVDLTGGKIAKILKSGRELVCPLKYDDHDCAYVTISTNADFTKEGVYIVKITRGDTLFVEYPIQVIDIDKFIDSLDDPE